VDIDSFSLYKTRYGRIATRKGRTRNERILQIR